MNAFSLFTPDKWVTPTPPAAKMALTRRPRAWSAWSVAVGTVFGTVRPHDKIGDNLALRPTIGLWNGVF
jgi:hypothetical protein